MNESFVFHADFIMSLPEELQVEWTMYAVRYGIEGIEPDFSDPIYSENWRKIKARIDADKQNYAERKEKNRIKLQKWRESHSNSVTVTDGYNGLQKVTDGYTRLQEVTPYTDTHCVSDSDSVYEYDSEYEYEYDSVSVSDSDASQMPDKSTPSQRILSNTIFELFSTADLPCCKKNPVNFYMQDYANAMQYLHNSSEYKCIHSDDLVGAVKNYISCYQNPKTYISNKMNFFSLVKSKIFYNLLPSNYSEENFYKFGIEKENAEPEEKKAFLDDSCPKCGNKKLYWKSKENIYQCDSCNQTFSFDEILGGDL